MNVFRSWLAQSNPVYSVNYSMQLCWFVLAKGVFREMTQCQKKWHLFLLELLYRRKMSCCCLHHWIIFRTLTTHPNTETHCNGRKHANRKKHQQFMKTSSLVWQHMCCKLTMQSNTEPLQILTTQSNIEMHWKYTQHNQIQKALQILTTQSNIEMHCKYL